MRYALPALLLCACIPTPAQLLRASQWSAAPHSSRQTLRFVSRPALLWAVQVLAAPGSGARGVGRRRRLAFCRGRLLDALWSVLKAWPVPLKQSPMPFWITCASRRRSAQRAASSNPGPCERAAALPISNS